MKHTFLLLLLLIAGCLPAAAANTEVLRQLNQSLKHKDHYEQQKLERIEHLRQSLYRQQGNAAACYEVSMKLFDEYKSYKYDSAYHYATQSLRMATRLGHTDGMVRSRCAVVFCLLSAGLYKEAFESLALIDVSHATPAVRKAYYHTATRLYYDLVDYNHAAPYLDTYLRRGAVYTDSLLSYCQGNARDSLYAVGMRQMKQRQYDASIYTFRKLLTRHDIDLHTRAIVTSSLGWISMRLKDEETAIRYLAQAAICDNQSVTKETTALCTLATLLYKQGEIQQATEYVRLSMADANFYDARQRIIQTGQILPIIEQDRYNIVRRQRNAMVAVAVIAVLFVLGLLALTLVIRRQMRRLQEARHTIEQQNQSLHTAVTQLREANEIKDEYIGRSLYATSEYIRRIEKLFKTIDRKIAARQFDDLRSSFRESTLSDERKSMYDDFDRTFLKLFPHFVERYNALFDEPDRKTPDKGSLTTEMRIFALIRMGITDADRIARFLNYSVHTINTYKTRVKNKALVENEMFEQKIMEI